VLRPVIVAAVVVAAAVPARARAQQGQSQLSFDATFGASYGKGGGVRKNRDGTALDALLAWRSRGRALFHPIFGFAAGVQGKQTDGPPCLPLPGSNCVPDYPRVFTLGILFGAEHQGTFGAARLMAGPTHYRVDGGGSALGGQLRLELASPPFHRVAVVGSARGGLVWKLDRQNFQFGAVGIGLGIYN
jgi:hypothetical protein